jgi:antiviral helicase SKI2
LEHCLFYSGELYKICESEKFMPQGLKAVKDAFKKKNLTAFGGGRGSYAGASAAHDARQSQRHEFSNRGKQNKHSGTGGGNQNNGNSQNNWGSRRSESSLWLLLINNLSKKSLLPVC